jgi:hypothetical protein
MVVNNPYIDHIGEATEMVVDKPYIKVDSQIVQLIKQKSLEATAVWLRMGRRRSENLTDEEIKKLSEKELNEAPLGYCSNANQENAEQNPEMFSL